MAILDAAPPYRDGPVVCADDHGVLRGQRQAASHLERPAAVHVLATAARRRDALDSASAHIAPIAQTRRPCADKSALGWCRRRPHDFQGYGYFSQGRLPLMRARKRLQAVAAARLWHLMPLPSSATAALHWPSPAPSRRYRPEWRATGRLCRLSLSPGTPP